MYFQVPPFAVLFVPLLLLLAGYVWLQRRRRRFALRYASANLVRQVQRGRAWRRHIPPLIFLGSLALLILALMRPAVTVVEPTDEGLVIITLDVSASMWANDMYPSRMEAAKAAAQHFVDQLPPKMRVGIVSFSETSYLNQVPTTDREQIHKAIAKLNPRTGTAIGNGLITSLDALYGAFGGEMPKLPHGTYAPAIIVLLTDGENTDGPSPFDVIDDAAERGIRVYTIGVGSPESTTIRMGGSPIQARLDENTLRELARLTDARYYNAATEQDLKAVYENLTTQLVTHLVPQEISFVFITGAFLLGVCALLFSIIWSARLP